MSSWHLIYEKVLPYIFHVSTPEGAGTGFLFAFNEKKSILAIATAAHVVEHADSWKLPIKLRHHVTGNEIFLAEPDRVVGIDTARDSASILISKPGDYLPADPLPMMTSTKIKKIGVEIAWAGYPAIAYPNLCMFTGTIAAFVEYDDSYLIDGVAINGVSGGPVFAGLRKDEPELIGTISAYMPNRQRGDTLPGILRAQDLTSFNETIKTIRSMDEARKQKEKEEQEKRQAESAGEVPPERPAPAPPEPQPGG